MAEREDKLVKARDALDDLWDELHDNGCRARGWGSKRNKNNPFWGSNITLVSEDEAVIINLNPEENEDLRIHGFFKNEKTKLGERVKVILKNAGLIQ
jgi:hypothetical protein